MKEEKTIELEESQPESNPSNPYNMNNYNIVQMVRKSFRAKGKKKWKI